MNLKKYSGPALLLLFFMTSFMIGGASGAVLDQRLQGTLKSTAADEVVPVIIQFAAPPEVESFAVRGMRRCEERAAARAKLIRYLRSHAVGSQQNVIRYLRQQRVTGERPLWLINALAVQLTAAQVEDLAALPEVESIRYDEVIRLSSPAPQAIAMTSAWDNLGAVKVPDLWAKGYEGEGVVVGVMDSGVDVTHPALAAKWRENGGWFDPYKNTTLPYDPLYPADPEASGHGTAVTGVILGDNGIGVAPAAQWIAAKIFDDEGNADNSKILLAFQWMLNPDGVDSTDDAPDIVNNSWGFDDEVNRCILDFQPAVSALKSFGIAVVFAAGNTEQTGDISPANYPESVAVGSVSKTLVVSTFSAVGPSTCDGSIYPELTAPGEYIETSTNDPSFPYALYSGTSFSTPHVAGVMALLLDAFPNASSAELERALTGGATDLGEAGPDNYYGYGLVNALAAYKQLNVPPVAAQLRAPANGADLVGSSVVFEWARGTDANGDPLTETLVYAENAEFSPYTYVDTSLVESTILLLGTGLLLGAGLWSKRRHGAISLLLCLVAAGWLLVSCGGGGGGGSSGSVTPTPVEIVKYQVDGLAPGTYYWKVVTEDSHGAVSESDVWTFTLQ
ncbi:MAG: S8 family serine peptidase [Desulfuromonadales bacterium]|nr:S8 family serine peptidase [Desulfuromonadales bacterium]MDW7758367.1 S8 family serine peptidase [Desulfuromonadales bacterium]